MQIDFSKVKNALKLDLPNSLVLEEWQAWLNSDSFHRLIPGIIGLSGLCFGLVFYYQCVPLIQVWRFDPSQYEHLTPTVQIKPVVVQNSIAQYHVFGISADTQRIAQGNLELRGIFMGLSAQDSTAVIGNIDSEEEALYGVGDDLPDGSRLISVLDDHIIIDRKGLTENLFLKTDNAADFNQPDSAFVSNNNESAAVSNNNESAPSDETKTPYENFPFQAFKGTGFNPP